MYRVIYVSLNVFKQCSHFLFSINNAASAPNIVVRRLATRSDGGKSDNGIEMAFFWYNTEIATKEPGAFKGQ
jgi:hypothetical protein